MDSRDIKPRTTLELLSHAGEYLGKAGVDEPRLVAEVLLGHVLGCERIDLYARFDYEPKPGELRAYRQLVDRASRHEPPAYLVGRKEFYSLRFKVTPDVLVPRIETELLVDEAAAYLRSLTRPGKLWDVCTGSGCVAIAIAANVPDVTVLATDISSGALAVAGENADANGVADRICVGWASLLTLPAGYAGEKRFDVITANPPYVAEGERVAEMVKYEPTEALYAGKDGLEKIHPIVAGAGEYLLPGGALIMEFGANQADRVRELMTAAGCFAEPKMITDHQGIQRAAAAQRK